MRPRSIVALYAPGIDEAKDKLAEQIAFCFEAEREGSGCSLIGGRERDLRFYVHPDKWEAMATALKSNGFRVAEEDTADE